MKSSDTLVYNFGSEAGFFSEFNNMVLAILYCETNNIDFILYSSGSKISKDLWNEYFLPFCKESHNRLNAKFNGRQPSCIPNSTRFKIGKFILKSLQKGYLTYELWDLFRAPNLKTEEILSSCQSIISRIWKYKPNVENTIKQRISSLSLPSEYIGIHIRRGDKHSETDYINYATYLSKVTELSDCKNLYIATDDYSVISDISQLYPDYSIFSLVLPNNSGFNYTEFINLSNKQKQESLILLFSEIEILSAAKLTIGTLSSNIGMYLGIRMYDEQKKRFHGVDYDEWRIW